MNRNNIEINVLINGRRASEYQSPMDFQTYIEGREGSNFEIELVNNDHRDVEMIVSVDGLAITDGKAAGVESSGYMVPARSRRTIPGWMLDGKTAAKFFFSGEKGGSYAEQNPQGDARNKGVIGVKAYARKYQTPVYRNAFATPLRGAMPKGLHARGIASGGIASGGFFDTAGGGVFYSNNVATSGGTTSASSMIGGTLSSAEPMAFGADESVQLTSADAQEEVVLGTGFGEATEFNTTQVEFERGDLLAVVELFYANAQGLKRRGIDVSRSQARPSAFPADEPKGCTPPEGWRDNR